MNIKIKMSHKSLKGDVMKRVNKAMETAMYDIVDHAVYLSSNVAPIETSFLRRNHTEGVVWKSRNKVVGHVSYSAYEKDGKGTFNYAYWIHEKTYKLGEISKQSPGATGWSGTHYKVGNKFLERVILGEQAAFQKYMTEEIQKELG